MLLLMAKLHYILPPSQSRQDDMAACTNIAKVGQRVGLALSRDLLAALHSCLELPLPNGSNRHVSSNELAMSPEELIDPVHRRSWLLAKALESYSLDQALDLARSAETFITGSRGEPDPVPRG